MSHPSTPLTPTSSSHHLSSPSTPITPLTPRTPLTPQTFYPHQTRNVSPGTSSAAINKSASDALAYASKLHARIQTILREIGFMNELFARVGLRNDSGELVEYRTFGQGLRRESQVLERIMERIKEARQNMDSEGLGAATTQLKSTNVKYYDCVWNEAIAEAAKKGLVGVRMVRSPTMVDAGGGGGGGKDGVFGGAHGRGEAIVDVVGEGGRVWIKVSTVSAKALSQALVSPETYGGPMFDEDSDDEGSVNSDPFAIPKLEPTHVLYTSLKHLTQTAARTRLHYLRPKVLLRLTSISSNDVEEAFADGKPGISILLSHIENLGVSIRYSEATTNYRRANSFAILQGLVAEVESTKRIARYLRPISSSGVILDTTVLITIASDISHGFVPSYPFERTGKPLSKDTRLQIRDEMVDCRVYLDVLLPLLSGYQLATTFKAYDKLCELGSKLGSRREDRRVDVLGGPGRGWEAFAAMSNYHNHPDEDGGGGAGGGGGNKDKLRLELPLDILGGPVFLPRMEDPVERIIAREFSPLNQEVLIEGWRNRRTVITQNQELYRLVERLFYERLDDGPYVVLVNAGRSFLGEVEEVSG